MRTEKKVWILEDDEGARFVYDDALAIRYTLRFFDSLAALRPALAESTERPDLLIADLRLPDGNFLDFLLDNGGTEKLALNTGFLVVSSLDDLDVFRLCFGEGALDFLSKPFSKNELVAKIERALMRPTPSGSPVSTCSTTNAQDAPPLLFRSVDRDDAFAHGELLLDPASLRMTRWPDRSVSLTAKELQILMILHRAGGEPVKRSVIQSRVWDGAQVGTKTLDVHLFNLRRKLENIEAEIRFIAPDGLALVSDPVDTTGSLKPDHHRPLGHGSST